MIHSYFQFLHHLYVTVLEVSREMNYNLLAIRALSRTPYGIAVETERQKLPELKAYNHACRNMSKLYRYFLFC